MIKPNLPLNARKAFESSARLLSFTRAGLELRVTQAAISHQVKGLEEILGVKLFRRLPRGLALTDEGRALLPPSRTPSSGWASPWSGSGTARWRRW